MTLRHIEIFSVVCQELSLIHIYMVGIIMDGAAGELMSLEF